MKSILLLLSLLSLPAIAQWQTTNYTLRGGWNAIYLSGDAPQGAIGDLFPATVLEVWRWNPNPDQVQFTDSPQAPSAGTPEWSVWKRGLPAESTFSQMIGQAAYLVKASGTSANTYTVPLKQSPLPPRAHWVRNGANLIGLPTLRNGPNYPTISSYFTTFPGAIAANSKIFKYVGGDLSTSNPIQIFSATSERLDRTQAYWFSAEVVEDFHGPLEIITTDGQGLDFGNSGSVIKVLIRNRAATPVTVTFTPVASESRPAGQPDITGPVPLTRRTFNTGTLLWTETPITAAITQVIAAGATEELQFGVNRGAMAGPTDAFFASFLRVTDSGNFMEVMLPARARKTSFTGLWVGDIRLSAVASKAPGSPGSTTPEPYPLRTLLHVAAGGSGKLLSRVFLGQLAAAPHGLGLCTRESLLKQDALAGAQRIVAAHLPLDQVISGSGNVAVPGTFTCSVTVGWNDPTNPFVHQYHPDHDNKNARFATLVNPGESYNITRACSFTFTATPPAGSLVTSGWGSSVLGGTYTETLTGLHREPVTVSGTFELRRVSDIGTLNQ